ncbi:unnamed protein product [Calypogeia fissa]
MGWGRRNAQHCTLTIGLRLLSLVLLLGAVLPTDAAYVGVVYGYTETGPSPTEVVQLLTQNGIYQVRIYDTNPLVLSAFANSSLEVLVGITNQELPAVGDSNVTAANWVKNNLLPYTPWLNITGIAVGSEVLTSGGGNLSSMLVPAMRYIYSALASVGLETLIKVTTPHNIEVLENVFPPSQGTFNTTYLPVILPLINFLSLTDSYFMVNLYPYFSYESNSQAIDLSYALFEPNGGVEDSYNNNMRYYSLFDALLDSIVSALNALNASTLPILVGETGWPSAGDPDEIGCSIPNAEAYNGNLAVMVYNNTGTPLRPYETSSAYIYELFNEVSRAGPLSERSWGLFNANTTPVYAIDLAGSGHGIIAGNTTANATWCVAKSGVPPQSLQNALDYACGEGGANCTAIQNSGPCWLPNTVLSHASYAMNSYFQKNGDDQASCDFKGLGQVTYVNPSYGGCEYILNVTALNQNVSPGGSSTQSSGAHFLRRMEMDWVSVIGRLGRLVGISFASHYFLHMRSG